MKQMKIRALIGVISFLILPITLFYLSPVTILLGASKGIVCGSFILFSSVFVLSLVVGRWFCGWLCPVGSFQDWLINAKDKKTKSSAWYITKFLIWLPWLLIIIALFINAGGIKSIEPGFLTKHGWSISETKYFLPYYIVFSLILLLNLSFGNRAFCHHVCWIAPFMILGQRISKSLKIKTLQVTQNSSACKGCQQCSSRCPMSIDVLKMVDPQIRQDADECILCHECIAACPEQALEMKMS